jgi:WD40 repeat protein
MEPEFVGADNPGRRLAGHSGRVLSVDTSSDGEWLASGGRDSTIRVWRRPLDGGSSRAPLQASPSAMAFSPCGRWLLMGDWSEKHGGRATLVDVQQGKNLWSAEIWEPDISPMPSASTFAFTRSGNAVAFFNRDALISERVTESGTVIKNYNTEGKYPDCIWYSEDEKELMLRGPSPEHGLTFFDRRTGARHDMPTENHVLSISGTAQGDCWAENDLHHHCLIKRAWNTHPFDRVTTPEPVGIAKVSPDGRYLAAAGASSTVYLWKLGALSTATTLAGHEGQGITNLLFSPDGGTLITHGTDKTLRFWNLATGSELFVLGSPDEKILSVALHPDGHMLVMAVESGQQPYLHVHRFKSGESKVASAFDLGQDEKINEPMD